MTARSKRIAVALVLAVAALAAPAAAQDLSVGYQLQRFSGGGDGTTVPLGLSVSVAGPVSKTGAIVGQIDWSRKHQSEAVFGTSVEATATFVAFAGGVRHSARGNQNATPFVE